MNKGIIFAIFFSTLMFFSSVGAFNVSKIIENGSIIKDPACYLDDEIDDITYVSGDKNNNNILDPGETWIFTGTESTP